MKQDKKIATDRLLAAIKKHGFMEKVKFIILYGSFLTEHYHPRSDIDFAVYVDADKKERFNFRLNVLGQLGDDYDVKTFQDLPIIIRKEVFKGKVVYAADMELVYEEWMQTMKEWDRYERHYNAYVSCL